MTSSLLVKLAGAFGLVVVVGMLLVVGLTSQATAGQFALYVSRSGQALAARIAPTLTAYYASTGSWADVEAVLADPWTAQGQTMGEMAGHGGNITGGTHSQMMGGPAGAWAMFGNRVLLAGSDGLIVADSGDALVGTMLDPASLTQGTPIVAKGQVAGTLLVVPYTVPATPGGEFLGAVNRAALVAGGISAGLALLVSGFLFFQIAGPLRGLAAAAQRIAAGELGVRAPVQSRDEVGQVALRFNQMAAQLERYAAERQRMIADIAHELRTPLAVIQGNLEAMLDGILPASPPELGTLHQEALLLNRLIGDLRTLSLAEAGQLQLHRHPVAVGDLIHQVAGRFAVIVAEKNITLAQAVDGDLPLVMADEQRLGQVLANLLNNALRYSPPGSQVTLGARRVGPVVELTVTDHGPGIPPDDLPHVFDRFWRSEHSRNRATGGSGLGLAIVKQLIEAHGGTVRVESPVTRSARQPGGTCFVLAVPLSLST